MVFKGDSWISFCGDKALSLESELLSCWSCGLGNSVRVLGLTSCWVGVVGEVAGRAGGWGLQYRYIAQPQWIHLLTIPAPMLCMYVCVYIYIYI